MFQKSSLRISTKMHRAVANGRMRRLLVVKTENLSFSLPLLIPENMEEAENDRLAVEFLVSVIRSASDIQEIRHKLWLDCQLRADSPAIRWIMDSNSGRFFHSPYYKIYSNDLQKEVL